MFKYIYEDENDITCFDKYFEYIESIKQELPTDLYEFASDVDRYNLSNKKSLHDAWLKSLIVNEGNVTPDSNDSVTKIEIELLGHSHDRVFKLTYNKVTQYYLNKKEHERISKHDDLLAHEIRLNSKGEIEHVIEFDNEISFMVVCSSFKFDEYIIEEMGVN